MAGGGGVEDDHVPVVLRGVVDELIEGGDFLGAGGVQLLSHHFDGLGGPATLPCIIKDAGLVGLDGGLGIHVRRPQMGNAGHRRGLDSDRYAQYVSQVRRRIGGQQQRAEALPGQPDGGRAGRDRLADASLAGEEHGAAAAVGQDAG